MEIKISSKIFNDVYKSDVQDYTNRFQVFYGGSGSGKSHYVAQKLVIKALADKRKVLIIRKVGATLRNSVWQMMLDTLSFFKIKDQCKINITNFSIELPNGSIFIMSGLDDSEKIKSIVGITDIWIEESSELSVDDFSQLDLRLRHPKAKHQQIYLSFNPISKANWVYGRFFGDGANLENVKVIHSTYLDNRFLPQAYINTLLTMRDTNPVYYNIYCLGQFGTLSKTIFNNWKVSDETPPRNGTLIVGLDFGYTNDPTALIAGVVDGNKLYLIYEHYEVGMLTEDIVQMINKSGFSKSNIVADSAEQRLIEEIRKSGVGRIKPCIKGQGSVLYGINKLQAFEIIVHPSLVKTIEELSNYAYKKDKKTGEYLNEPEDANNHLMDALRYSIQIVDKNKVKKFDKRALGL